jgi:general secretion pathway protein L
LAQAFAPLAKRFWDDPANIVTLTTDGNQLEPLLTRIRLTDRVVSLLVQPSLALRKTVSYPAAVAENLQDVIANDLDRQTPFTADLTYFGWRVLRQTAASPGDETSARLDIELTVVPRRQLKASLAAIHAAGGTVGSIKLAGDGSAVELLPLAERPAKKLTRQQKINLALLGALATLVLLVAIVPSLLARAQVHATTPLVGKAAAEAQTTRRIESELQRLTQEHDFAMAKKLGNVPLVEVLDELTKLAPDTSWMRNLEIKTLPPKGKDARAIREVQIMGETASASKMIEALEASTLLQNATQRGQTTRGDLPNTERFHIATELKPRALPEKIEIAMLNSAVAASPLPPGAMPTATSEPAKSAEPATPKAPVPTPVGAASGAPTIPNGISRKDVAVPASPPPPTAPSADANMRGFPPPGEWAGKRGRVPPTPPTSAPAPTAETGSPQKLQEWRPLP